MHIYKRKINPQTQAHLSAAVNILAKIIFNRPNVHLDQAGFKPEVNVDSGKTEVQ